MANAAEAEPQSDRKGNPVIYLALALPVALAAVGVSDILATHYSHIADQPKAVVAPAHNESQPNPATLIKPQNVKYIG